MNQIATALGIPNESVSSEDALGKIGDGRPFINPRAGGFFAHAALDI